MIKPLVAALALTLAAPLTAYTQEAAGVSKDLLLQTTSSWDGVPYAYPAGQPEISVLKITIPAHEALQWHIHPMPNAAYVLSGELTIEERDTGKKDVLKAGQVLPEVVNTAHRGLAGDEPVVLIVFYAGAKGMPLSKPATPK